MILMTKGKVAITPIFDPSQTKGGIWIPDQSKERCDQGIIKYIASDIESEGEYQIGDYVLFSAYDGTLVQLEGDGLMIIMKAEALVCKIAPPEYLNTVINGLYFKTNMDAGKLADLIYESIKSELDPDYFDVTEKVKAKIRMVLMHPDNDTHIEANYEQSVELMSQNLTELGYPHRFRFKDRKATAPKASEITPYGR